MEKTQLPLPLVHPATSPEGAALCSWARGLQVKQVRQQIIITTIIIINYYYYPRLLGCF